jgi:7-keto-8-aminopelargonate synthetase-like enzyme
VWALPSRLITGTMDAHDTPRRPSRFHGPPAAALFATGYAANLWNSSALDSPGDAVFSDALNHASLIGARLSRAEVHVYSHRDVDHLEALLRKQRARARRSLIITDSLFSMDGVTAPLREIALLARSFDTGLLVDEAHALGVLGENGRGLSSALGIEPDVVVGTLGKAFGVAGAFVAASDDIVLAVRNQARSFVYSTAPPPMIARAAVACCNSYAKPTMHARPCSAHARSFAPRFEDWASTCRTERLKSPVWIGTTIVRCSSRQSCSTGTSSFRESGHRRFLRDGPPSHTHGYPHRPIRSNERLPRSRRSSGNLGGLRMKGAFITATGTGVEDLALPHHRVRTKGQTYRCDQAD